VANSGGWSLTGVLNSNIKLGDGVQTLQVEVIGNGYTRGIAGSSIELGSGSSLTEVSVRTGTTNDNRAQSGIESSSLKAGAGSDVLSISVQDRTPGDGTENFLRGITGNLNGSGVDMGDGDAMDLHRKRAMALISSDKTSSALNIRAEAETTRDRYGRHLFGQSCLMARRLVEAGTRFVTVHYDSPDGYGWDSHRTSDDVRDHLLPTFDQGCSALLTDLDERGLLDETLVIAIGEMGRTPIPNATWGRGHWSTCFPALIAGAGVRGGIVYGKSDKEAAYPDDKPVSPEDLAKTIYWSLGIDPDLMLMNRENRPIPIVDGGKPVMALFG
jgi:hypothetical protein